MTKTGLGPGRSSIECSSEPWAHLGRRCPVAVERGAGWVRDLLRNAGDDRIEVHVPAGVVARVWRGGRRQANLARVLNSPHVRVVPLDYATARAVGELCAESGQHDVVDVHVARHAREWDHAVMTSDPDDLRSIDRLSN